MVSTSTLALFLNAFTLLNITRTQNGTLKTDVTYGSNPTGTIMYTSSGFMNALLTTTDPGLRPWDLTLPAMVNQSDAQWADVGRHSLGYLGPFRVVNETGDGSGSDGADGNGNGNGEEECGRKGVVVHGPLVASTLPRFVGSLQRREFSFSVDGRYLNLKGNLRDGVVDDLWWERIDREVAFV